jgi:sec-independent protein translocase protein TatC
MADSTEELPPEEQEVQGGAVKSFLEHLEDLRWMLVKSGAVILVAMCVCIFGTNKLVAILEWPLERAALIHDRHVSLVLSSEGLKDFTSFALKVKGSNDPVSLFLKSKLSEKTASLLAAYDPAADIAKIQKPLFKDLNAVIDGDCFYTAERFKDVTLRKETAALVAEETEKRGFWGNLFRNNQGLLANRLLLEDAYPDEISRSHYTNVMVSVFLDRHLLGTYELGTNRLGDMEIGTNHEIAVSLQPLNQSGQQLLAVKQLPQTEVPPKKGPGLIFLDPAAPFISSLHLAFFGGLFIASPFVFFYLGQFLMPALKIREKRVFMRAFYVGVGLFVLGVCIAYFGVMPRALRFAELYANWMGVKVFEWRAETYFSFLVKFMLGMGLGFEMPVVLLALVKIGLLNYKKLTAMRRYMIVINLIMGALLTTPEVFTQVVMGIALQILFEVSVWITWYWERQARKRAAAQGETLDD